MEIYVSPQHTEDTLMLLCVCVTMHVLFLFKHHNIVYSRKISRGPILKLFVQLITLLGIPASMLVHVHKNCEYM